MNDKSKSVKFFEQLSWGIWIWSFIALLCVSIYLSVWAPLGNIAALLVTGISFAGFYSLSIKMRTTTKIEGQMLISNKAKIDLKFIKSATALDAEGFKRLAGVDADPAAFLAINFWSKTGVKVELKDKKDPTPYWLISSKDPKRLVKALVKAQK
ncbi:MAG: DUF3093 family protein [Actinobacteria bacterium]|nr:DUF3093 family protein [Actinomycetota bacterium]